MRLNLLRLLVCALSGLVLALVGLDAPGLGELLMP